ncbi:helix-turn-helix domain-containing protein [Streptomyces sp. NPDC052013]|uniref:helix-turn-helix domain-containing protein n=1 Tax=Streptomyces sp. NPDC052013 TaxID=3365679 RepID=UPI0037CE6B15
MGVAASLVPVGVSLKPSCAVCECVVAPLTRPQLAEARRVRAAELFEQQRPNAEIARVLGVSAESVRWWKRVWENGGTPALRRCPAAGRPPKLVDAQVEQGTDGAGVRRPGVWLRGRSVDLGAGRPGGRAGDRGGSWMQRTVLFGCCWAFLPDLRTRRTSYTRTGANGQSSSQLDGHEGARIGQHLKPDDRECYLPIQTISSVRSVGLRGWWVRSERGRTGGLIFLVWMPRSVASATCTRWSSAGLASRALLIADHGSSTGFRAATQSTLLGLARPQAGRDLQRPPLGTPVRGRADHDAPLAPASGCTTAYARPRPHGTLVRNASPTHATAS